ncbi:L-rhamnose/proton symporter RhaT [Seonamhaeicola marinus]|uniref:Sugar:proton symporter n=1 Tax=Seonamhaeicola marinus TaxID=1912246 RepID=A0A5D0H402_9FLAO|nr:L-rhamnose/proton symporter RhaT [Seonamhaeicola marinus]TYA66003.1 sugar:proton symporter [Seonamhaeicola marinus]
MWIGFIWVLLAAIMLGFYAFPSKSVKGYQVENLWGVFWLFAMFIVPILASVLLVDGLKATYTQVPIRVFISVFFLSLLWGVGNLLWGISISKIGMALGFSLLIGVATLVGSVLPFFMGAADKLITPGGLIILAGILIIMFGIVCNGKAGLLRETNEQNENATKSGNMKTGIIMCVLGGICAAGFNLSYHVADSIGEIGKIAQEQFNNEPWVARLAVMLPAFIGSGVITVLYFVFQIHKNNYWSAFKGSHNTKNIMLIAVMALVYVASLIIYGLGAYNLGAFGTSVGFAVFQTGCIMVANLLGIFSGEWNEAGTKSKQWLYSGLGIMTLGIVIVAYGNFLLA